MEVVLSVHFFFRTDPVVTIENSGAGAAIPSYTQSTLWVNAVWNNHCSILPLRCNDSQGFEPGEKREQSEDVNEPKMHVQLNVAS